MIDVRSASSAGVNGTVLTVPQPAGTAAGDVLIVAVAGRGTNTITCTPAAGFVEILNQARSTSGKLFVYRKVATASEPASYAFTLSTSSTHAAGALALTGVDTANIVNASASAQGASSVTHTCPSVTTTAANTLAIRVAISAALALPLNWTWPSPAVERVDATGVGTGVGGVSIATEPFATAGASGTRDATCAQAVVPATATIALTPMPDGQAADVATAEALLTALALTDIPGATVAARDLEQVTVTAGDIAGARVDATDRRDS